MYNKEFGTNIAVVRGLNAYGPRQKTRPVKKIMPTFITAALEDKPIIIYGDGEQIMDMIYVTDLAEILVRALLMDHGAYDTTIEAGLGRDESVNDIADLIITICKSRSKIEYVKMRPGEIPGSVVKADVETLKYIDYPASEMIRLEEGIEKTVEWYRE
jgi:UDP-glucose 4-epimerase